MGEIKDVARQLLVKGGPQAVSLRAISREMGMTPSALYRYFPSLDALLAGVRSDLFEELGEATMEARDSVPGDDPLARLMAMARAFRTWGLAHRAEFGLMLGPPPPGVEGGPEPQEPDYAPACVGVAFLGEIAELNRRGGLRTPSVDLIEDRLAPGLREYLTGQEGLELPVIFAFLAAWARLYGIIAMEIFGHMAWAVTDSAALFETELINFAQQLSGSEYDRQLAGSDLDGS
ncbi:TetR/AcrR family transcriptional regulator [Streptomyces iconiensis]|uniref:TetR/AcrR family transcriptional regulator n=1 Tax=Streptomyces iconiensis TaxID=1384038 RepID=A0ABT6ZXW8_9ACTN|nr:TetR/AcrR family transcriptional regulator [Streptomyces iconiensis]MDJ1133692.1 TetR/AcrR family transcriptional regulator [Streptomyces iconiensis]